MIVVLNVTLNGIVYSLRYDVLHSLLEVEIWLMIYKFDLMPIQCLHYVSKFLSALAYAHEFVNMNKVNLTYYHTAF